MNRSTNRWLVPVLGATMVALCSGPDARAGGHWSVGIGIGVPVYPYYRPYPYYYRPYPVYVAPAPVVVAPPPVIVQSPPQPVVVQPAPVQEPVAPPPAVAPTEQQAPAPRPVVRAVSAENRKEKIDACLQQLSHPDEGVRIENVMKLGKLKAVRAIDPLAATLSGDSSPNVRDAAARALGLIGSPAALPALRQAALGDRDPNVRHSASFAIEIIQSRG